jgi:hypothetical protein
LPLSGALYAKGKLPMNINVTLFFELITFSMFIFLPICFYLGRRKVQNPAAVTIIGFFLCFLPPFILIYVAMLSLKNDLIKVDKSG